MQDLSVQSLKKNVSVFNADAQKNGSYVYSTGHKYSSLVCNERMTRAIINLLPSGIRTLIDIGCGDGVYTEQIRLQTSIQEITGCDPAKDVIPLAQKRFPHISFVSADILQPHTLPAHSFEIGILRGVLHHLPHPAQAIVYCACVTNHLILVEPNGNNPIVKLFEIFSSYHREHEEQSFSTRKLKKWCVDAGWHVTSATYIGFVPCFFPELPSRILHFLQPILERIPLIPYFLAAQIVIVAKR